MDKHNGQTAAGTSARGGAGRTDSHERVDAIKREHAGQMSAAPIAHYEQEFASADPQLLAARSGVPFEGTGQEGVFKLEIMGRAASIAWPALTVRYEDGEAEDNVKLRILMAELLLRGKIVPPTGKLLRYTDVPWGQHYWKAFEGRCIKRLAFMFADARQFADAALRAGAQQADDGDASADFAFVRVWHMPVAVRVIVWEADEEFAPSAQMLFSDNAPLAFSAEDLAAVGDIVNDALKRARNQLA